MCHGSSEQDEYVTLCWYLQMHFFGRALVPENGFVVQQCGHLLSMLGGD
jgi:hypothetical protein